METTKCPRVFTVAAFLVAVVAGLYAAMLIYKPIISPVLSVAPPFLIAIVLALLLDPLLDFFERRGMSRGMGVAAVGLTFIVAFLLVGFLLVPQIVGQASMLAENLPDRKAQPAKYGKPAQPEIKGYLSQAQDRINEFLAANKGALERLHLPKTLGGWGKRYSGKLQTAASAILNFFVGALTSVASRILWLIIIPLATLWLLKDIDYIKAKIIHFTPERHQDRVVQLGTAVGVVFGKYVRGMLTVALLFSLVSMLWLTLAGLKFGLIIGLASGLFYMVPYIGVPIMAGIAGIMAFVQPPQSGTYAIVLMILLVIQSNIIFDMFITPRVVGRSVGVHPVLMLFALALGAQMAGVLGMILAVPVAASIQVAVGQFCPRIYDKVVEVGHERDAAGGGEQAAEPG